jgi:hypothetical protein
MKVRRVFDKFCEALLFLFRMLAVHAQIRPYKANDPTAWKGISLVPRLRSIQFLTQRPHFLAALLVPSK